MTDRLYVLNTLANIQTLQGQCSILMITAAEQKFDEKKIVRGPGGKFGEKKDEKKEPPSPPRPQISPEEREKQKQLNERVEKIVTTAREFAFGKNAVAKMQGMVNSLKGKFDRNQVFREAQKTSQQLQRDESLDKAMERVKDRIRDLKNTDSQSSSINQWQAAGIAIGLAVAVGGILGVVQKKKALKIVEDLFTGKKINLDIEGVAKKNESIGSNVDVEKVVNAVKNKLQESIKNTKKSIVQNETKKSSVWDNIKRDKTKKKETIAFDINKVPVKMEITEHIDLDDPVNTAHRQVEFKARESLDKIGNIDKDTSSKIALRLVRVFREIVKESKDDTVFRCAPHIKDGAGEMRTKAYVLMGFGTPDRPGDFMYGIVKNGKLEPYYPDLVAYEKMGLVD